MTCYLPEKHRDKPLLQLTKDDFRSCLGITNHTCANTHYVFYPNQHPDGEDDGNNKPPLPEPHPPHTETKPTTRSAPKPEEPGISPDDWDKPEGLDGSKPAEVSDADTVTISKRDIISYTAVGGSILMLVVAGWCFKKRVGCRLCRNKTEVNKEIKIAMSRQNNRTDIAPISATNGSATRTREPLLGATPAASVPAFPHPQQRPAVIPRAVVASHRATEQILVTSRRDPLPVSHSQALIHNGRPPVPRNYNQTAPPHDPTVNYGDQNIPPRSVALLRQHQFAPLRDIQSPHYDAQLPQPEVLDHPERLHRDRDSGCSVTYPEPNPGNQSYAQYPGLYQRQQSYDSVAYPVETKPKMFLACGNRGPAYATIYPQTSGGQSQCNEPVMFVPEYVNGQ